MSSFNSQRNSAPINVTPILPSPSLPFISPSPALYGQVHSRIHTFFIPPFLLLCLLFLHFSKVLPLLSQNCFFFPPLFCRLRAFKVNGCVLSKCSLACCGCHVTWIDFSRDIGDHILSLWRFHPRAPLGVTHSAL